MNHVPNLDRLREPPHEGSSVLVSTGLAFGAEFDQCSTGGQFAAS